MGKGRIGFLVFLRMRYPSLHAVHQERPLPLQWASLQAH
jgi:hypothetical protein